jgi:hypothetical protein
MFFLGAQIIYFNHMIGPDAVLLGRVYSEPRP